MATLPIDHPIPPLRQTEYRFEVGDLLYTGNGSLGLIIRRWKAEGRGATSGRVVPWFEINFCGGVFTKALPYTQHEVFKLLKAGWKVQQVPRE